MTPILHTLAEMCLCGQVLYDTVQQVFCLSDIDHEGVVYAEQEAAESLAVCADLAPLAKRGLLVAAKRSTPQSEGYRTHMAERSGDEAHRLGTRLLYPIDERPSAMQGVGSWGDSTAPNVQARRGARDDCVERPRRKPFFEFQPVYGRAELKR